MPKIQIKYKRTSGDVVFGKYELLQDYLYFTEINESASYNKLDLINNKLIIQNGFRWDGPSGLTIDTEDFMRGSLVHDAFYRLMKKGLLDIKYRKYADKQLYKICREDGMGWFRANYVYFFVRLFGEVVIEKG